MSIILTFKCESCGWEVKALIKKRSLKFLIDGILYSQKNVLSHKGYYVCIVCREKTTTRFEKVY